MSGQKNRGKRWLRVAVCGLLLAWIFHSIFKREGRTVLEHQGVQWDSLTLLQQWQASWTHGPTALVKNLMVVDPVCFLLSFVLVGATLLIGIVRWRMALKLQGLPLSFVRTGEISLVAHFFNSFLLGSTGGDLLKAYYAARETHHLKAEAVTTVFVDRLIGLFSMLLFACLMMIPNYRLLLEHEKLAAVSGLVVAMLLACGGLVAFSFWGGLDGFLSRWSHLIQRVPKAEGIKRSLIACRRYGRSPGFLLRALSWSMLLNLICVLQAAALCRGLGINIPFMALSVIIPIIICISALPITPSGLGLRENLFVLMLAAPEINVDATRALSLSLLVFFGSLAWSMLGGLVYACLRQSQHLDEIDRDEDTTTEKP